MLPLEGREESVVPKTDLLQGTLDLLLLKVLALGPNHGWGISNRIRQMSAEGLNASQGSLYPALHRLEVRGEVRSEMTASENNRRARVYTITAAGRRRLQSERKSWELFALSMRRVLETE
jgi:PadR family transcriptional regulator, regulatory protein PadR